MKEQAQQYYYENKDKNKYINLSMERCMVINILNKKAKILFINEMNDYSMKNIMNNTKKRKHDYKRYAAQEYLIVKFKLNHIIILMLI
jgi:hypothetical protein